ncbi:VRR-NUC domain-containing protein [Candidatus Bathyarchaeota archaeon]|nr:VRR-NUC domain-containing protein [Candidatus Bathyarchaeota archaeon]
MISEEDFLRQVIDLAHVYGWKVAHFRPAQTARGWRTAVQGDGAGFPDLVLVRERVIFAELKSEKGKVSDAQWAWKDVLQSAMAEFYIWRPSEWDEIVECLKR